MTYVERTGNLKKGDMVKIRITGADIYDLYGEIAPEKNLA
ncbi:MAG: hypothetical protein L0213_08840 [Candidatus Dadabacteria bacterium]|nr:hypothetical protein [Candidatus Dadabacteria bacterium]